MSEWDLVVELGRTERHLLELKEKIEMLEWENKGLKEKVKALRLELSEVEGDKYNAQD